MGVTSDLSHAYLRDHVPPLPAPLRAARVLLLLLAAGTAVTVLAYLAAVDISAPAVGQSLWVCVPAVIGVLVATRLRRPSTAVLRWGLAACALWLAAALASLAQGDPRGLTQLLLPAAVLVLLLRPASRAFLRGWHPAPTAARPAPVARPRAAVWRLGAGLRSARASREAGQGTMEYIGVFAAVVVVLGLVGVAVGSPGTRASVVQGVQDLVCAVTGQGCSPSTTTADGSSGGEDGSGEDGSGEDGSGEDGSGEDGGSGEDEGCSGFWGCAWEGVQQVGSGVANVFVGAWDDVVGLYDLVRDPSLFVDGIVHLWNNPGDITQLIWDDESGGMWDSGDYGGAIGRTVWNVGSWFIPGVNIAKIGSKGGKLGKLADLASELGSLRRLADDAADAADTAADAARRGDADAATEAAEEARRHADDAAEEARRRGCPIAAGATSSPGALALGGGPSGTFSVDATGPLAAVAVVLAADGCGEATDAARDADEAADAAEAAAARAQRLDDLARDPAHGGQITDATRAEAEVGLGLEESGQVPGPIRRSENPGEEFIDGAGQAWDVKAYRSEAPNGRRVFDLDRSVNQVRSEVRLGENVMIDTRNLDAADAQALRDAVAADPSLADNVLFYP